MGIKNLNQKMLVKLEKLTFYHFQPNPDLFYYYAATDTLTFRGIATPELAEALYDHLNVGEPFKCKIVERDDQSFKLVELLDKATPTSPISQVPQVRGCGALLPEIKRVSLQPKQISVYKSNGNMYGNIKSMSGNKYHGVMEKGWFLWYLTMMRREKMASITINDFSKCFDVLINRKSVSREEFLERQESTYLDNKDRFFFANDSPTLRQPEYLKKRSTSIE